MIAEINTQESLEDIFKKTQPNFNFKRMLNDILVDSLENEEIDFEIEFKNKEEGFEHIFKRYFEETGWWKEKRMGRLKALEDWLRGLPVNVHYWNEDIISEAKKYGFEENRKSNDLLIDFYWIELARELISNVKN